MAAAPNLVVGDLPSWRKFVAKEDDNIRTRICFKTEPNLRGEAPLTPADFAIDWGDASADRAGADPAKVGPWGQ